MTQFIVYIAYSMLCFCYRVSEPNSELILKFEQFNLLRSLHLQKYFLLQKDNPFRLIRLYIFSIWHIFFHLA